MKRNTTAKPDTKTIALTDVRNRRWNPGQFNSESDKLAYGRAWDYFYTMSGDKSRNWHARA